MRYIIFIILSLLLSSCNFSQEDNNKDIFKSKIQVEKDLEATNLWGWNWLPGDEKWKR